MSTYTTSIRTVSGSYKRVAGHPVLAAVATAAVMAATVLALVLSSRANSDEPSMPVQVQTAGLAPGLAISEPNSGYAPHAVYIVGSTEQSASVRAGINDANAIRDAQRLPLILDEVLLAASDVEAAQIAAAEEDANRILAVLYRVENRVVDLRR